MGLSHVQLDRQIQAVKVLEYTIVQNTGELVYYG